MPRAGFYAVESGKISFRKDGNWYSDDERIDNQRIALLFSKSIRRNPDGSFYLQVAEERAPIAVEDTPYVVKAIEDDAGGRFTIVLNDDSREALNPDSLEIGAENVLYTGVKDGQYRARFLRPAYYHLSRNFEADHSGGFFIRIGRKRYPLKSRAGPPLTREIAVQPLLHVVLVRPEIPQNTGSIARLTAAAKIRLHLVGPLGFSLEDRYLKRAGLDYWPLVDLKSWTGWEQFAAAHRDAPLKFFSARGEKSYLAADYRPGDFLVFGSETTGLGARFIATHLERVFTIPIFEPGVRSLNLANAVSIVVYEALRQTGAITA